MLSNLVEAANKLRLKLQSEDLEDEFEGCYRLLIRGKTPKLNAGSAAKAMAILRRVDTKIVDVLLEQPKDDARLWPLSVRFLHGWLRTREAFASAPQYDYAGTKTQLERLNTSVMNAHVDKRLLSFMESCRQTGNERPACAIALGVHVYDSCDHPLHASKDMRAASPFR